ncbi:MAG: hypothetical protein J6L98_06305 [Bacteroidales bacterium]|nr:hypothetical protein [Bacteroidales bacterium]
MLRKLLITAFILISIPNLMAQRRVSAGVEVKTLYGGKVTTVASKVYCTSSGRLVQVFDSPYLYYTITNPNGELTIYIPGTNEVYSERKEDFSDRDDVLYLFLSGRGDDMGLGLYGYKLSGTTREEGGLVKRTYVPSSPGKGVSKVELVQENYLPIYLAYYNSGGAVVSRVYLSSYNRFGNLMLPLRVTSVQYTSKKDSTLVRTLYSDVKIDGQDPMFDFQVPSGAKPVKNTPKGRK